MITDKATITIANKEDKTINVNFDFIINGLVQPHKPWVETSSLLKQLISKKEVQAPFNLENL